MGTWACAYTRPLRTMQSTKIWPRLLVRSYNAKAVCLLRSWLLACPLIAKAGTCCAWNRSCWTILNLPFYCQLLYYGLMGRFWPKLTWSPGPTTDPHRSPAGPQQHNSLNQFDIFTRSLCLLSAFLVRTLTWKGWMILVSRKDKKKCIQKEKQISEFYCTTTSSKWAAGTRLQT